MTNLLSAIRNQLKRKTGNFLLNQTVPPPLVYFLIFFYAHYNRQQIENYDALMLSFVTIKLAFIANFNCAFMAASFLNLSNPALGLLFFGIACLSCNQKWKIYLLLIAIGDAFTQLPSLNVFFLAIAASYMCYQAYHNMIFANIKDNKQYFTGFFVIATYSCLQIFLLKTGNTIQPFLIVLILGASFLMGMSIIKTGIQKLHTTDYNQIHNVRLMFHYFTLLKQDIKISFIRKTKIQLHRRKCMNPSCFCHNPKHILGHNYFIRQLYENVAQQFSHQFDPIFFEDYLIFLANNSQMHKALYLLSAWKPQNYFTFTAKLRCRQRIENELMNLDSSNIYELEYEYALTYDGYLRQLMESINSILQQKLLFWTQVSRQSPLMIKMQETGSIIVEQMYILNCFYSEIIKMHEKKLYSFDATVIYAMYILSTTNFKDYAEIIIKNTSKLLEEVFVFEKSVAQTFAVRVRLQNDKRSYIKDRGNYLSNVNNSEDQNNRIKNNYKLAIDAASRGFCNMINISKNELIGEELNVIIPHSYKEVHKSRLNDLVNFNREELTYIKPYALLHKEAKLPIKGLGSSLVMGYVCFKFMLDIEVGLTIISAIKRLNDKAKNALVTVDGEIVEKQDGFIEQIVDHPEVKRYIGQAFQSWLATKTIKQEKFNIMVNSSSYSVTVSSPFLSLFLDKLNLTNKNPPIHIQMLKQESNKHKNTDNDNKVAKELKEMENVIACQDNEQSASTKSSNSAINKLSTFSEGNSIPIYRYVLLSYLVVVTLCVASNLVGYLTADLAWDNTVKDNNPINDIINMQKLQKLTYKLLSNLLDVNEFYSNGKYFNMTEVSSYFGPKGYQSTMLSLFKQMESEMRFLMKKGLEDYSLVLQKDIQQKWSSPLTVTNYFSAPNKTSLAAQNLTFLQLMLNFVVDTNLAAKQRIDNKIMIETALTEELVNLQNTSNFLIRIDKQISQDSERSLLVQVGMIILVVLLLVPGYAFLRSRLPLHEKIFDLVVSIDVDLVIKEIQSLKYISNIVKKYQQQSETLKNNVMDYQENIIYPKRHSSRRASVHNQIIVGLEKYDHLENNIEKDLTQLHSERQELTKKPIPIVSSESHHRISKFKSRSLQDFQIIKQQSKMVQLQQQRKRDGQLNYKGSESDPKNKVLFRHLVFYVIIFVFVIFLGVGLYLNYSQMLSIKSRKDIIYSLIDQHLVDTQLLLLGKLYFRNGMSGITSIDEGLNIIVSFVERLPTYNYYAQNGYSFIYPNCTTLGINQFPSISAQKYCEYNYSYLILLGEYGALFKQSFESRQAADRNLPNYTAQNQLNIYNQIVYNISEKIFYMQSLNHKLQNMTYTLVDMQFADMIAESVDYKKIKFLLMIFAFCWAIVCLIIGVTVIVGMKRQYLKQVYMITFLNQEMIVKSKRVESFLDSLSKSSN